MAQLDSLDEDQVALVDLGICPFCKGELKVEHGYERQGDNSNFDESIAYLKCNECWIEIWN